MTTTEKASSVAVPLPIRLAVDLARIVRELREMNTRTAKPIASELAPYIREIRGLKCGRERLAG